MPGYKQNVFIVMMPKVKWALSGTMTSPCVGQHTEI